MNLASPHILVGSGFADALATLKVLGVPLRHETEPEECWRAETPEYAIAIYPDGEVVRSVWYNDPLGRDDHTDYKIGLYLGRYGPLLDWEMRNDNGWMRYWFNDKARVAMVYGVHMDMIRFNCYNPAPTE